MTGNSVADQAFILAIAAMLDFLIGDPWDWLHPVQVMGWCIHHSVQLLLPRIKRPWQRRGVGVVLGMGLVAGSSMAAWGVVAIAHYIHPLVGLITSSILLASCFAGRSLRDAATDVLTPLMAGHLEAARSRLSRYVGRDTEHLTPEEIYRAVFETVTENATDGVMAPLFYSLLGAMLPVGSVPLAIAYKAASTLDSMVGYRREPYTDIGYFSAKLDDLFTWIPCRLTVITIALLSGKPMQVWCICQRDAPQDPSPNAGWSECVYAAALNVQVGGINIYRGQVTHKPTLGNPGQPITAQTIHNALHLTRRAFLLWLSVGLVLLLQTDFH